MSQSILFVKRAMFSLMVSNDLSLKFGSNTCLLMNHMGTDLYPMMPCLIHEMSKSSLMMDTRLRGTAWILHAVPFSYTEQTHHLSQEHLPTVMKHANSGGTSQLRT